MGRVRRAFRGERRPRRHHARWKGGVPGAFTRFFFLMGCKLDASGALQLRGMLARCARSSGLRCRRGRWGGGEEDENVVVLHANI